MPAKGTIERHKGGLFEVLHGVHDEDGVHYEAGEVVESEKDLDRMFAEKFKRRGGLNRRPRDLDASVNEHGNRITDVPLHARKQKAQKPLKKTAAKATDSEAEFYDDEDVEETEKKKTLKAAGPQDDILEGEDIEDDEESGDVGIEEEDEDNAEETELGKDVSAKFEDARKADLKVFKGDKGYHVVDADEPETPLHRTPLATKGAVDSFVEDYRTGDQGRKSKAEKEEKVGGKKSTAKKKSKK